MNKENVKVAIIDDDEDILFSARVFLSQHLLHIETHKDPRKILEILPQNDFDLILLDMNFKKGVNDGKEGLYWLNRILEIKPDTIVVMMTAYGDIEIAVEAIKLGAHDFVLKPWNNQKFLATLLSALRMRKSKTEIKELKTKQQALEKLSVPENQFIGQSSSVNQLFSIINKVAQTDANILITGENGTGKELIAQAIHRKSLRAGNAFVRADLGSLNENLFENELFGHVKGAFTDAKDDQAGRFEIASGGTIFLDEIGNLSLAMQSKLLTVLQTRKVTRIGSNKEIPVNIRLICATNADLNEMVANQEFREDLLYRINTVELPIPPLRERKEDIADLVDYFLNLYAKKYHKEGISISRLALRSLENYSWPGNVRELQHAIERAVILSNGPKLEETDFTLRKQTKKNNDLSSLNLDEVEEHLVKLALQQNQGNISKSAKQLGITRAALYRRIEKYGLQ